MATAQEILTTIAALEKQLASLKGFMESNDGAMPAKKAKKERAPRDPDAPPRAENPYFAFLNGRIRPLLKGAAEKQPGTVPVFFSKHLMSLNPDSKEAAYTLTDDQILAAYREWATPENLEAAKVKRKAKDDGGFETASDAGSAASAAVPDAKPEKPKRVLSEEQKAAMKAGREAKKAEKEAAAAAAKPEPATAPAAKPEPAAAKPAPKFAKKEVKKAWTLAELQDWKELELDGEIYGYNARGDTIDGEGNFMGHWNGKELDREASEPADWAQVMA